MNLTTKNSKSYPTVITIGKEEHSKSCSSNHTDKTPSITKSTHNTCILTPNKYSCANDNVYHKAFLFFN